MRIKGMVIGILLLAATQRLPAQVSAAGVLYVNTYKSLAISEEQRSGIPAAIILAQGLHESQAGTSELCKASNNHFGIKCKDEWKGAVVYHDDDARQECFRSYPTAADSYRDHTEFLLHGQRYAFLFNIDPSDYQAWAYGLRKAGYATNTRYPQILIRLIKDYNLEQYTLIALGKMRPEDEVVLTMPGSPGPAAAAHAQVPAVDSQVAAVQQVSVETNYPEGEFTINKTRVVYVRGGVSLLSVAGQYDIPLARLLEFNDMQQEDVLVKGQLIFLQRKRRTGANEYHVMREGETLYDVSQSEGIRLQDMLEMNQLTPDERPAPGERIYLQGSAPARPRLVSDRQ
ncbi:MAG TPA: glucosaminidase domain-containing protein [Puia sp.]|nr:glucosaminidase domain-containing protein [Puia sp.]